MDRVLLSPQGILVCLPKSIQPDHSESWIWDYMAFVSSSQNSAPGYALNPDYFVVFPCYSCFIAVSILQKSTLWRSIFKGWGPSQDPDTCDSRCASLDSTAI